MFDMDIFKKDVTLLSEAAESFGLDFFDMDFLVCPPEVISFVAAYSFPARFAYWGFGKRFYKMMLQQRFGLARIHELVYFSDPCQAFLSRDNSRVENMLVAAHVIAHSDFFKNNINFAETRGDAADMMSLNGRFIRECIGRYGLEAVEQVLDAALALGRHIVPENSGKSTKEASGRDLLLFISGNSDCLEDWQREIIRMIREESRYFLPMLRTRLLNEGWAAYWHTRLMEEMSLNEKQAVEFAMVNGEALGVQEDSLNPYRIGMEIFTEISGTKGDKEIFQIRGMECDISFVEKYLREPLLERIGLAAYRSVGGQARKLEVSTRGIKASLLRNLDNCGVPRIAVDKGLTSEEMLCLRHGFDGRRLNVYSTRKTLEHIHDLWGHGVSLFTRESGRDVVYVYDGACHYTRIPCFPFCML